MAQAKRIYAVTNGDGQVVALVNAVHPAQAVGVVIRGKYSAKVAGQQLLMACVRDGMEVVEVGEEPAAAEAAE
jgi:hypothetical protein